MSLNQLIIALRQELVWLGRCLIDSPEYKLHVKNAANIRQKIKDAETSIETRKITIGNYKNGLN